MPREKAADAVMYQRPTGCRQGYAHEGRAPVARRTQG